MDAIIEQISEPEVKPEFHIDSESAACWLLRRLANLEAEKQRVKAQAVEILAGLDADAARLRFLYGAELEAWAR